MDDCTTDGQTQLSTENHFTQAHAVDDMDHIVIAGTSHLSLLEDTPLPSISLKPVGINARIGGKRNNKTLFLNQGIRRLRLYSELIKQLPEKEQKKHKMFFIVFKEEYSAELLAALNEIVTQKYGAKYIEVNSAAELLPYLNAKSGARRVARSYIHQVAIFSHGLPSFLAFGYETSKNEVCKFGMSQVAALKPAAFDDDAEVFSYACRTGAGLTCDDRGIGFDKKNSLAQHMANVGDIIVHAFGRRSDYIDTYGKEGEAEQAEVARRKDEEYKKAMRQYDKTGKAKGQPRPNRPIITAREKEMLDHINGREANKGVLGYPLDPLGAASPVKAGEPLGDIPADFFRFTPEGK